MYTTGLPFVNLCKGTPLPGLLPVPTYLYTWSLPTKQPYGCQAYATSQAG